jgi:MFS superfamily sulfate permease-like transporter
LPPQAGLYTLLASLVLYAVFGSSKKLVVAGTSASAVLVYSAITALHPGDAPTYTALVARLILDLDANDELDITSSEALEKLLDQLGERHVRIGLAHVHATTAEMMRRSGTLEKVGTDHIFPNLVTAVTWASTAVGK